MDSYSANISFYESAEIYPQRKANSNQTWVSVASVSESLSLEIKAALYRRRRQDSPILEQTLRELRRIWSVIEYFSSDGKPRVISKIIMAALMAA